jgi:glycogen synthase
MRRAAMAMRFDWRESASRYTDLYSETAGKSAA